MSDPSALFMPEQLPWLQGNFVKAGTAVPTDDRLPTTPGTSESANAGVQTANSSKSTGLLSQIAGSVDYCCLGMLPLLKPSGVLATDPRHACPLDPCTAICVRVDIAHLVLFGGGGLCSRTQVLSINHMHF